MNKPILFIMVRLDNVKNLTRLVEWYAKNDKLRELVNLVVFRWISSQMNRVRNEELYRVIEDTNGAFIQPAFYDAFGLTMVEAMTCGLPTFATLPGGPAEIIRIQEKYTWQIYSKRLLTLAGVYGFWKHVSKLDRIEIRHYLEMFYALKYRKLAESVPLAVDEEK
nr:sucrose synthase [Tanacetum cinerariifolium]